jgi:hypothetical protein
MDTTADLGATMRINQYVANIQRQSQLAASASSTATSATQTTGNAALDKQLAKAQKANQVRLSDAAKGFTQATQVRDGLTATNDALASAKALVTKAQDTNLSANDRTRLQTQLTTALKAVDQGTKTQTTALSDQTLSNQTYAAAKQTVTPSDQLGKNASNQYSSVASLKNLDLTNATADQLTEAAKVLASAQSEVSSKLTTANQQVARIGGRVDTLEGAQSVLGGTTSSATTASTNASQRNFAAALSMIQQNTQQLSPGSLFNSIV